MFKPYSYALRKFFSARKLSIFFYLMLSFLTVFLSLLELYLTQSLVTAIQNWTHEGVIPIVYNLVILLVVLLYVNGSISCLRAISITNLEELGLYEQERIILDKISKLTIIGLDSPNVKSLTEKAKRIELFEIVSCYTEFITNSLTFIIFGGILLKYKSISILVIIIITLIIQANIQKNCKSKMELLN